MIVLHGFGENFGVTDPSPFVLKVDGRTSRCVMYLED